MVDFHNFEFHLLSNVLVKVADRLDVHLGTRQECFEPKHVDNQTTLRAALDRALDDHVFVFGLVHLVPSVVNARRLVAYDELAVGVLLLLDEDRNLVARFQLGVVTEFRGTNDAF